MGREALDAILLMFENHLFPGFKGEHYDLKPRHMIPKPVQRPHPPLWVAASALDSWHYAGLQGFGCIGVTRNTPAETAPFVKAYREAKKQFTTVAPSSNEGRAAAKAGAAKDMSNLGRSTF